MMYLLFFLLRDGPALGRRIHRAIPLEEQHNDLSAKFITVIRATLKGNLIWWRQRRHGAGGLIFWVLGIQAPVLWGVLMAFLSLLPAVGAGLGSGGQ